MTPQEFIAKWQQVSLKERSAAQQHFLDLCEVFQHPKPAEADPKGEWFTFEKGAAKQGGGDGWADVWKRGYFGWEYKVKHKDLDAAYNQLLEYREALENPPLLVLCDMDRMVVHTNFTGTAPAVHDISLAELGTRRNLEIVRCLFHAPDKLKPGVTSEALPAPQVRTALAGGVRLLPAQTPARSGPLRQRRPGARARMLPPGLDSQPPDSRRMTGASTGYSTLTTTGP